MRAYLPLSKSDLGKSHGIPIGCLFGNEVGAIKETISKQVTKGNYAYVGDRGIGKYYVSQTILIEAGFLRLNPISGKYEWSFYGCDESGKRDVSKDWNGKHGFLSQTAFLNSPDTQEQLMNEVLAGLYDKISKSLVTPTTTKAEIGGYLVAAYNLGFDNVRNLAKRGAAAIDKDSDYMLYLTIGSQAISIS